MGYGKVKKYKAGAELKAIPAGNDGLPKLPKEVRNNMGYMKTGGEKLLNMSVSICIYFLFFFDLGPL